MNGTPKYTTIDDRLSRAIGGILGRTPSGLFVLTAADAAGRETGMLASWVQQASFAPPMITVALNRKRYLNDWLQESPRLAISFLGESHRDLLKHFAAGFAPDEPAFEGVAIARGATGLPLLARALGYVEGHVRSRLACGDHSVYAVEITGAGSVESLAQERPMVHIRSNGFKY
jgi:flavin reductase (DIM6/NTAB) family NADH-FMN oxidoreductase RutF